MSIQEILFGTISVRSRLFDAGTLALRLFAGFAMAFAHGAGKLPPSEKFIEGVGQMGFPLPVLFAWLAALSEAAGGFLIAIGLVTRPAAVMVLFTMGVAAFVRHADDPFKTKELALLYFNLSLALVFLGAGGWSVDALVWKGRTSQPQRKRT